MVCRDITEQRNILRNNGTPNRERNTDQWQQCITVQCGHYITDVLNIPNLIVRGQKVNILLVLSTCLQQTQ